MVRNLACGAVVHVHFFEVNRIIYVALQFFLSTLKLGLFACIESEIVLLEVVARLQPLALPLPLSAALEVLFFVYCSIVIKCCINNILATSILKVINAILQCALRQH